MTQIRDKNGVSIQGHIKIHDPESGKVYVNKRNAIHYENMSIALAQSIANEGKGFISSMAFGNGGTSIDPTGIITYLTPNSTGTNASLYNQTYSKIVDDRSVSNLDPQRNKIETITNFSTKISNEENYDDSSRNLANFFNGEIIDLDE